MYFLRDIVNYIEFAGQKVGITQVDDKIWLVQFMDYELGYFDTDTCKIELIDNQLT